MNNLGSGFKCYSNTHKLVSRIIVLCLNISIFQGPVDKAVVYLLQAEPIACTIRVDTEIQGVKLPGEKDGECIETTLCMFAEILNYLIRMINLSKYFDLFSFI